MSLKRFTNGTRFVLDSRDLIDLLESNGLIQLPEDACISGIHTDGYNIEISVQGDSILDCVSKYSVLLPARFVDLKSINK
jgi:hypothetical protein